VLAGAYKERARENAAALRKAALRPDLLTEDDAANLSAEDWKIVADAIDSKIEQAQVARAAKQRTQRTGKIERPSAISPARKLEMLRQAREAFKTQGAFYSALPMHELRALDQDEFFADELLDATLGVGCD
jgi:hypothetical protein